MLLVVSAPTLGSETEPAEPTGQTASNAEIDSAELDEARNTAVVTASGSAEARALAAANVYTIGWEEIARRRYQSLGEILADVPGLYVVNDLVLPSTGVRGVTGGLRAGTRIVKVMINNVAVSFRPELTAFLGPEYLPVQMIERVEVAKGPLSALYGANAFVATVNIITRGQSGATLVLEAAARVLSHQGGQGWGGVLIGGYNEADRSLLLALNWERFDRSGLTVQRTFPEQDPELGRYRSFFSGPSQNDISSPKGLFGQYTMQTPAGAISLQGGVQMVDAMGEFQLNSVLTHQSRFALENDWLSARHERQWSDAVATSAWLAWSKGAPTGEERLYLTGTRDVSYNRRFSYEAIEGGFEAVFNVADPVQLKTGVDVTSERHSVLFYSQTLAAAQGAYRPGDTLELIGDADTRRVDVSNAGAYAQAAWLVQRDTRVTANARVDFPNLFPPQYSWRLAVARRFSDALSAKLIAGRAFQTPSTTLLFGLPGFGNANNVIGQRTLSNTLPLLPQTVQSLEAAASLDLGGRAVIEAALFAQEINDQIEFVQVGPNFQAKNQGQAYSVGGELSARVALGRLSLLFFGELVRPVVEGYLSDRAPALYPSHRLGAQLNFAVPELRLNLNMRVTRVGERGASQSNVYLNNDTFYALPAFTSVDLTLATLGLNFLGGAQTALSLTVRNLLDERYSEGGFGGLDVPTLGRVVLVELRQSY